MAETGIGTGNSNGEPESIVTRNNRSKNLIPMSLQETLHRYRYGTLDEVMDTHMADPTAIEYDNAFAGLAIDVYGSRDADKYRNDEFDLFGPGVELLMAIRKSWMNVLPFEDILSMDLLFFGKLFGKLKKMGEDQLCQNAFPGQSRAITPESCNTIGRWERRPKLRKWSALERYVGKSFDKISLISEFGFLYDSDKEANFDISCKSDFMPIIISRIERRLLFRFNEKNETITFIAINDTIPNNYNVLDLEVGAMCLAEWRWFFWASLRKTIVNSALRFAGNLTGSFMNAVNSGNFELAERLKIIPQLNIFIGMAIQENDFSLKNEMTKNGIMI